MSYENYDANGHGHDLGLPNIAHLLRVSYPTSSGCIEQSTQITHIYLILEVVISTPLGGNSSLKINCFMLREKAL